MFNTRTISRSAILVMVAVVALAALTGSAAATGHTPTVDSSSDIDQGVVIQNFNANDSVTSNLVVNTDNASTIDSIEVEITLNETGRNLTAYQASDSSTDYSLSEDVDTDSDGTVDSDQHTWAINHSEFQEVPMQINEQVDLDATITATNSSGHSDSTTVTFTLENSDERSVIYVSDDELDDDAVGVDAVSETEEPGTLASWFLGAENTTTYDIEDERDINGSNTDLYVYYADDAASDYDDTVSETETGDITFEQATVLGSGLDVRVAPVFAESADVNNSKTYAVYDEGASRTKINLGDSYENETSVTTFTSNQQPDDIDRVERSDLAAAYGHLTYRSLVTTFGPYDALQMTHLSDIEAEFAMVGPLLVTGVSAKRRETTSPPAAEA